MNIPIIIQHLRPGSQWSCSQTYESLVWMGPGDKPTLAELQAAELPAEKAERIRRIKVEAGGRILSAAPQFKQNNAALGLYDAATTQAIKDGISAIRAASDQAEVAVNALTTVEEVQAFTW